MGRDYGQTRCRCCRFGFNPRAHVGRDCTTAAHRTAKRVSIHAPTWGATAWPVDSAHTSTKFQSTRPRGARQQRPDIRPQYCSFNPRAHVGRDQERDHKAAAHLVSIHAPTWGATGSRRIYFRSYRFQSTRPRGARRRQPQKQQHKKKFQSTRPRGARRSPTASKGMGVRFQSTRPRGARPTAAKNNSTRKSFNPRAHVGRDLYGYSL